MTTHFDDDIKFSTGAIDLDTVREKIVKINLTAPDDGTEQDTGEDLPADAMVTGVFLNVVTAEATGGTKTIDVGTLSSETGGDADGFLDGVDVSNTGLVKGTLDSGGQTLGALLRADETGSSGFVPEPYLTSTNDAVSVSYTAGSADFEELVADLYIRYIEIQ